MLLLRLWCGGDYGSACRAYNEALELDPGNGDALVARGASYANQGRFVEALRDFDAALERNPRDRNAAKYRKAIEEKRRREEVCEGREATIGERRQPNSGSASLSDRSQLSLNCVSVFFGYRYSRGAMVSV